MSSTMTTADFAQTLPEVIRNDTSLYALGQVIAGELRTLSQELELATIYTRIDALPETVLDILAYDFKVDWWDYGYTLEEKWQTLKDSWNVHRHLGTKYAVQTAISAIYPDTEVQEWFAYGGEPGGTDTVPAASLLAQTALKEQKQQFTIVSSTNVTNGKKIKIQITNLGLTAGYTLNQIGIWAHVDSGASVLFAILQDDSGIAVPDESELADFVLSFYAVVNFSNEAEFTVTVDSSALVSMSTLTEALQGKADLGDDGKIPESQLPGMDYIKTSEKGAASGVAELDATGKVPDTQLPDMNYDAKGSADAVLANLKAHLADTDNPHAVTLAQIGAAAAAHSHDVSDIISGIFGVPYGGTGASSFTSNYPLFGDGTGPLKAHAPLAAMALLGDGYGTCATAAATTAKVVTLADFKRRTGSRVTVYFTYAVPASATMNVNSTGAAAMRVNGSAIAAGMIPAASYADFVFDGSYWQLIAVADAPRISYGSYTGTGTYGSSNPNTLTFTRKPRMILIGTTTYYGGAVKILCQGMTYAGSYYNSGTFWKATWSSDGKTVSWYATGGVSDQGNASGQEYSYVAIYGE